MTALRLVPQDPSRAGGKVLLIDDDPALLDLMAQAFTQAGYVTLTATNGRKGLGLVDSYQPDLVVTDIVMPEMEGIGAILQIKRKPQPPLIIAISGAGPGGRRDYLSWARHLGADEVLAKPFRTSQLLAISDRLIAKKTKHLN
ncbi:response regulator [Phenylobacterium sp.]|jgi:CheY-like chemotaxis protein|uniref:response regulator n=1 Tax=Phenylobacterium sp. TaxID=1871053 RepID=UPI002F408744